MRSINKVIVIGNLTRDTEMRATPNGQTVTTFGIATNREWITKDGIKKNSAEFHECVAWARLAEICNKYLKKGRLVYIEGYLKTRSWEKDGQRKFKTEVVVQDMIMLEKKPNEEEYVPENAFDPFENDSSTESIESDTESVEPAKEPAKQSPATPVTPAVSTESTNHGVSDSSENPIDRDLGL